MDVKISFQQICLACLTCFLLSSCGGGSSGSENNSPPVQPAPTPQESAGQTYLNQVIDIMRANAVTRNQVNWTNLESEVNQLASGIETISQSYPAITRALELINTNHSFLNSPGGSLITYPSNLTCRQTLEMDVPNDSSIGYIRVDAVVSVDAQEAQQIATDIQTRIAERDSPEVTKWVVDLRNNQGGNMWPMIAGLGPLFDNELLGHFIDPDELTSSWGYRNGSSILNDRAVVTVSNPYTLHNPLPQIAVLVSNRTASSGEATLIAFKKQLNARLFGTDSCGLSTANTPFTLSDRSTLFLTTAVMADREQEKYGDKVLVDQATAPEQTLAEAVDWLNN